MLVKATVSVLSCPKFSSFSSVKSNLVGEFERGFYSHGL